MNNNGLSERIKIALRDARKTQRELAKALGVGETTVSAYTNAVSEPSSENIAKIAKICGVTTDWLITGENPLKDRTDAIQEPGGSDLSFDWDLLDSITTMIGEIQSDEEGLRIKPHKLGGLIRLLYNEANTGLEITKAKVIQLIKLAS